MSPISGCFYQNGAKLSKIKAKPMKHPKMVESKLKINRFEDKYDDEPEAKYANGGEVSMKKAEEDNAQHPDSINDFRRDYKRPPKDEYMADHFADGGSIEDEEDMMDDASIAAACMARRKYARGGEILSEDSMESDDSDEADLSRNADEDANMEDKASFDALRKENYSESEGLEELDYDPKNIGDEREKNSENEHDEDVVSAIRRKMSKRSPISR